MVPVHSKCSIYIITAAYLKKTKAKNQKLEKLAIKNNNNKKQQHTITKRQKKIRPEQRS